MFTIVLYQPTELFYIPRTFCLHVLLTCFTCYGLYLLHLLSDIFVFLSVLVFTDISHE
jgi:hypothetical protein